MKTAQEAQNKLNELIAFCDAETPEDHACLGAMLLSAGVAFMVQGDVDDGAIDHCVEQGRRAARGQVAIPVPGSQRQ